MEDNLYQVLELQSNATPEEIKKSYRRLAMLYHPDKNHSDDAEDLFMEIQEAYDTLSDPALKATYDQSLLSGTPYNTDTHVSDDDSAYYDEAPIDPITGRRNYKYHRTSRNRRTSKKKNRILDLSEVPIYKAFYFTGRFWCIVIGIYLTSCFGIAPLLDFLQINYRHADVFSVYPLGIFATILLVDSLIKGKFRTGQLTSIIDCKDENSQTSFTTYKRVVNYRIFKTCDNGLNEGYLDIKNSKTESKIYSINDEFELRKKYIFYYTYLLRYNYAYKPLEDPKKVSTVFILEERFIPLAIAIGIIIVLGVYTTQFHNLLAFPGFLISVLSLFAIYKSALTS